MMDDPQKAVDSGDGVPKAVANRLSLYLRELQRLIRDGQETTNSTQLGQRLGISDAQVRKDLTFFGQFGYPGIGYRCQEIIPKIRGILGTDRAWRVCVVGLGNLGRALLGHRGFSGQGFQILAAFDNDRKKLGNSLGSVPLYHVDELEQIVRKDEIRLGMLAVPVDAAQGVSDRLVAAGIDGILNFAPVAIQVPAHVSLVAVDLAIELEQLCFAVMKRGESL